MCSCVCVLMFACLYVWYLETSNMTGNNWGYDLSPSLQVYSEWDGIYVCIRLNWVNNTCKHASCFCILRTCSFLSRRFHYRKGARLFNLHKIIHINVHQSTLLGSAGVTDHKIVSSQWQSKVSLVSSSVYSRTLKAASLVTLVTTAKQ